MKLLCQCLLPSLHAAGSTLLHFCPCYREQVEAGLRQVKHQVLMLKSVPRFRTPAGERRDSHPSLSQSDVSSTSRELGAYVSYVLLVVKLSANTRLKLSRSRRGDDWTLCERPPQERATGRTSHLRRRLTRWSSISFFTYELAAFLIRAFRARACTWVHGRT